MYLPDQPPPNAPAPPPSEEALRSRRLIKGMIAFAVVSFLILVISADPIFMMRCGGPTPLIRIFSKGKTIYLALMEFEKDYGSFPSVDTVAAVREKTGSDFTLGTTSSNDFMRQLIAVGLGDERLFYVPVKGTKKPDNIFNNASKALEKGECGFAYIPGLSTSDPSDFPIVIGPLIWGTDQIDAKVFKGKALVLTIDGSANEANADKDGHVIIFGKRLLDPANPLWRGRKPVIAWPE